MRSFLLLGLMLVAAPGFAGPSPLEALVSAVRTHGAGEARELAEREQRFVQAREQRAALLAEAKRKLAAEQARRDALKKRYEANETAFLKQSEELEKQTGTLGELFGVSRQVARETAAMVHTSLVSAQLPGRAELPERLGRAKTHPTSADLEGLWHLLLEEMLETGKVARFRGALVTSEGMETEQEIVRVGGFNVVASGHYLRYLPETGRLVELGRQPPWRLQQQALTLQEAGNGIAPLALDPSRGAILSLMIQTPNLTERIREGGMVGYAILALGALALLLVLERAIAYLRTHVAIRRHRSGDAPHRGSPLGRLRQVDRDNPACDGEALAHLLDHTLIRERRRLRRFLPTIAIFASIAPLLGLLGTVAGMIETFQSITLFGTGDPKLMSSGISLALVTTELGLVVAIPVLLLHSWLNGINRRFNARLEEERAMLMARREEQRHDAAR